MQNQAFLNIPDMNLDTLKCWKWIKSPVRVSNTLKILWSISAFQHKLTKCGLKTLYFTHLSPLNRSSSMYLLCRSQCTLSAVQFQPCVHAVPKLMYTTFANKDSYDKKGAEWFDNIPASHFWPKVIAINVALCVFCMVFVLYYKPLQEKQRLKDLSAKLQEQFKEPGSNALTLSLQIAECELILRRGKEEESLKRVKDTVLKSLPLLSIVKMARDFARNGHSIHAIILYNIIHVPIDAYRDINISPNDIVKWTSDLITDVSIAVRPLLNTDRDLAIKYGLQFMLQLLGDFRRIENADVDMKTLNEACCLHNIANINIEIGEYKTALRLSRDGLSYLEEQFGEIASKSIYYGALLSDVGLIHEKLGQYSEAERYYLEAMKSYGIVIPGDHPWLYEHRDKTMERLAIVQKRLGK